MSSVMKATSEGDNELDLELQATHSFILNCGSDHLSEWGNPYFHHLFHINVVKNLSVGFRVNKGDTQLNY